LPIYTGAILKYQTLKYTVAYFRRLWGGRRKITGCLIESIRRVHTEHNPIIALSEANRLLIDNLSLVYAWMHLANLTYTSL
jgi:hypothetical protein